MIVTVDARLVYDKVRRGIAKTIIALYQSLAELRPDWRFVMFYRDGFNDDPFTAFDNILARKIDIRGDRFGWWDTLRLPIGNVVSKADIFHAPAGLAPRRPLVPMVATINDLIPIDVPQPTPIDAAWGANVRRTAHKAKRILTASDHAKERIVALFKVAPEKITTIQWGATSTNPTPIDGTTLEATRQRLGVTPGCHYVLHFGMPDPRKNTARTIDAWASLPAEAKAGWELLIVGVHHESLPPFQQQIQTLGLNDVHLHSYLDEEDVRVLMSGAGLLCYPTTYEGFGLPILDAFTAQVPVLSGNRTSIPEVAGDAAMLVDPHSTEAIAEGLRTLLQDQALRRELVQRGSDRVQAFTWRRTAEDVARVYEELAGTQ